MPEGYMEAMVLERQGTPLVRKQLPVPVPGPGQLLVRVEACGVCRTDLHVLDGDLEDPALPLVLGHEIVGTVEALGKDASRSFLGKRVGIPWLGWTCGRCGFCTSGRENLCDRAKFTGYTLQGGYAQYTTCWQDYALGIPDSYDPVQAAPLLCAGLIGYRSLVMCGDARRLGIYGFGAAAHIVAQVAVFQGREVYAFTRPGDHEKQGWRRSGRGDTHDGYPRHCLQGPLVGKEDMLCCQPHEKRRGGVHGDGTQGAGSNPGHPLSPGGCEPRAGRPQGGQATGSSRAGAVAEILIDCSIVTDY